MTFILFCFSLLIPIFVKGNSVQKFADFGKNFTIPCSNNITKDVTWIKLHKLPGQFYSNINILKNGSLLIGEADYNNSGTYLCKSIDKNSTEILSFFVKNIGQNFTLTCPITTSNAKCITWFKQIQIPLEDPRIYVWKNGSIFVDNVTRGDYGEYICMKANVVESVELQKAYVIIRTPPPPLKVTIKPSTILVLILWNITGNGGYPIINFTAEFRLGTPEDEWIPISPNHITPNSRQLEVYSLRPNTTYEFRMWATNQLGRSPVVNVFGTTLGNYKEEDLLRHVFREIEEFNSSSFYIDLSSWTGIWSAAVGVFTFSFLLLCFGTIVLLSQEWDVPPDDDDQKSSEPLPNIILNPNFENGDQQISDPAPDDNLDDHDLSRLNNSWVMENTSQKI